MTSSGIERAVMYVAVGCAVVTTAIVARRQFAGPIQTELGSGPPTRVADWRSIASVGHRMGPVEAPVTIVEFADFQCPACRRFIDGALDSALLTFPGKIAVVFRNWPLPYHPFAYQAARAAECGARQGRFRQLYELMYQEQDSLGVKPFVNFAKDAGVPDITAFLLCSDRTDRVPVIERDIADARSIGGTGTPTIVVNDLLLHSIPDAKDLEALVSKAIGTVDTQAVARTGTR